MEHGLSFLPDSDGISGPSAPEYFSMVLDTVVERIGRLAEQLAVDGFLWQVDFGGVGLDAARASVDRLIASVIPRL